MSSSRLELPDGHDESPDGTSPDHVGASDASLHASGAWNLRAWGWLLVVLGLAMVIVLPGLGGGTMRVYDEALYGSLARNALEHDHYLYAIDHEGALYRAFSKPPLTVASVAASFHLLGASLTALRLPFALGMIATIGVAFAWGRRIGGLPFGVAWAGTLMMSAACVRWGRAACIEPMLMLWILLGCWAYHEALERRGRSAWAWAGVSALALVLAVATKQVVVMVAIGPIVMLELWRGRLREAAPRLLLVLGAPLCAGLGWLWLVFGRLGDEAIEIYVRFGVLRRMAGYRSGLGRRALNELSGVVGEACDPFPWILGVAGLVVLVLMRPTSRREAGGALLLPLIWVTTVVVFDNLSDSMMPWYAYDVVVPLTGGIGFLVAGLVAPSSDRLGIVRAIGGALALAVGAIGALGGVVSQLDVAVVVGLAVVVGWPRGSARPWAARMRIALLAAAALAFVLGALARPERDHAPGAHEQLMQELAARGIERVHVASDSGIDSETAWRTYYGPKAQSVSRPPWRTQSDAQAYVTRTRWPSELVPPNGSEIIRGPGMMAIVGHLDQPPWTPATLETLLAAGPISFEAEHLPGQREGTVRDDASASGGMARAVVVPRGGERAAFVLGHGPGIRLPAGRYSVEFVLRWGCGEIVEKTAVVAQVLAGRQTLEQVELACPGEEPGEYEAVRLEISLRKSARVEFWVKYMSGEVWFDRVVVERVE